MWREFFGASTRVIGIDTDRAGPTFPRDANVKVLALDSTDADAVRAAVGSEPFLSVIVDDGCHLLKCIWKTFAATYPLLLDDGIYLVEDFPAYGLAPNGALAEASRRLLVERRVCEDTWCARRSLRGAAGRRRACVLPDAVPTERLVAILSPRRSRRRAQVLALDNNSSHVSSTSRRRARCPSCSGPGRSGWSATR